jgi:hypothetical protein
MTRKLFFFLYALLLSIPLNQLFFVNESPAANTFSDQKGRFTIDLPTGWSLQPQTDERVYVFKETSESIIIEYFDGASNRDTLFQKGTDTVRSSMPAAEITGDVLDRKINGNPARWGIYKDTLAVGAVKVVLYGALGSVQLKNGGLYFLAIVNEPTLTAKQRVFEDSFNSVRDSGSPVTGMVDEGKAAPAAAAAAPLKFVKHDVSITFPPGWVEVDKSGQFEAEFLGWFESRTVPGTAIFTYLYTGFTAGYTHLRIRGLKTIAQMYPEGQEDLKKAKRVTTETGNSAEMELWRGYLKSGTANVVKQSPMGIVKTKGGWLMVIGSTPDASGPWLEDEFAKILKTVQ